MIALLFLGMGVLMTCLVLMEHSKRAFDESLLLLVFGEKIREEK